MQMLSNLLFAILIGNVFGNGWFKIDGSLKQISISSDGTVMGVDETFQTLRKSANSEYTLSLYHDSAFHGAGLGQVSVGSNTTYWVLDRYTQVYKCSTTYGCTNMGIKYGSISIAADGSVYGVDGVSNWWRYIEGSNSWVNMGGQAFQISVGSSHNVYYVGTDRKIHKFVDGVLSVIPSSNNMQQVHVSSNGDVFSIDLDNNIYQYFCNGDHNVRINGPKLKWIESNSGYIIGVGINDTVYIKNKPLTPACPNIGELNGLWNVDVNNIWFILAVLIVTNGICIIVYYYQNKKKTTKKIKYETVSIDSTDVEDVGMLNK